MKTQLSALLVMSVCSAFGCEGRPSALAGADAVETESGALALVRADRPQRRHGPAAICPPARTLVFEQLASGGPGPISEIRPIVPAINDCGVVAFSALDAGGAEKVYLADGSSVRSIELAGAELHNVTSLQLDSAGDVAIRAFRHFTGVLIGVYSTDAAGAVFTTRSEAPQADRRTLNVALSPNGTLAYGWTAFGAPDGAVFRGPVAGPVSVLVPSDGGSFDDAKWVDVNDAGVVSADFEYKLPIGPLTGGTMVFDGPVSPPLAAALVETRTAIEQDGFGNELWSSINAAGKVAFATSSTTMRFSDPPNDMLTKDFVTQEVKSGVYVSTPTLIGTPKILETIADSDGPFAGFGRVELTDSGRVVFEALLDNGHSGIYDGPDPVANKIVESGDLQAGVQVASVLLGGYSNARGQLALIVQAQGSGVRHLLRVSGL
jgi:hypothetical protein